MRVVNARLGFANNSSSSHSMIVVSKKKAAKIATDYAGDGYGWGAFTLADPETKLDYLATAIWQQLSSQGDDISAMVVCRELLGLPEWSPSGSIDHQSVFDMPSGTRGELVEPGFAKAFAEWIQSAGVLVLGGNDNSDEGPALRGKNAMPFGREDRNPFVAKHDAASGTWTLFNTATGAKARMAFEPGEALELEALAPEEPGSSGLKRAPKSLGALGSEPGKMAIPELVDVKITDFCDFGCAYCYQGSTPEGAHAKLDDIRQIAREFFKAGVLEVALGGGEPTRHPLFADILEIFDAHGIVVNFTTRDLSFLKDDERRSRALAAAGSVAVSVSSLAQIQAAQSAWEDSGAESSFVQLSFQYVVGTASDAEFKAMVSHAVKNNERLTLLGYKDSGRGLSWRQGALGSMASREARMQSQASGWMDLVKEAMGEKIKWSTVCIDTALARECEAMLGQEGIPRHLWHKSEGIVSMYVDAVSMRMGKSSFEAPGGLEIFDAAWRQVFQSWSPDASAPARKGVRHG